MSRVLILFIHPAYERSRTHRVIADGLRELDGVTFHDLYENYPDFDIDVRAEQALLVEHDRIVFQHPTYWYSVPPLLKQWQDLVLQLGWAYGEAGRALQGKWAMHVTSTGGTMEAYSPAGAHGYTLPEFFRPLERTATLCRMEWLPPYVAFGSHRMSPDERQTHAAQCRRLVESLRDDTFSLSAARRHEVLTGAIDDVVGTTQSEGGAT